MQVFAGLIIGLFGSLHCIGMCGPIVAALGVRKNSHYYTSKLLYNLGRITTYALIGAVFGFFGAGLEVFGLQQAISVLTGVILLVTLFFDKIKKNFQIKSVNSLFYKLYTPLKIKLGNRLKSDSLFSSYMTGILNGLLPCGLVYSALAGAMAMGSVTDGILFMILFGAGTVPALFSFQVLFGKFKPGLRLSFNKVLPVFTFVLALIFILRGLNLGIPYISPSSKMAPAAKSVEVDCCH